MPETTKSFCKFAFSKGNFQVKKKKMSVISKTKIQLFFDSDDFNKRAATEIQRRIINPSFFNSGNATKNVPINAT